MAITNGYATLAELKSYLKIDDSVEDALLEQIIESASRMVDDLANRSFTVPAATSVRYYYPRNVYTLPIDDLANTTGLVVQTDPDSTGTYATTLTLDVDYLLEPLNAAPEGRPYTFVRIVGSRSWGFSQIATARPAVKITGRFGWPAIPDAITQATLILSADLYKRKDSVGGVLGLSEMGAIRMSPLGRDVAKIVRAYRKEFFA